MDRLSRRRTAHVPSGTGMAVRRYARPFRTRTGADPSQSMGGTPGFTCQQGAPAPDGSRASHERRAAGSPSGLDVRFHPERLDRPTGLAVDSPIPSDSVGDDRPGDHAMTDVPTATIGLGPLRPAPAGLPDPVIAPPVIAEAGDPFTSV